MLSWPPSPARVCVSSDRKRSCFGKGERGGCLTAVLGGVHTSQRSSLPAFFRRRKGKFVAGVAEPVEGSYSSCGVAQTVGVLVAPRIFASVLGVVGVAVVGEFGGAGEEAAADGGVAVVVAGREGFGAVPGELGSCGVDPGSCGVDRGRCGFDPGYGA